MGSFCFGQTAAVLCTILTDYLAILLAEKVAIVTRAQLAFLWDGNPLYTITALNFYGWIPCILIFFLWRADAYRMMRPILNIFRDTFYAVFYGMIGLIILFYLFRADVLVSRMTLAFLFFYALFFIYAVRYLFLKFLKKSGLCYEPIIIIGAGYTAEALLRFFEGDLGYRYKVVGLIDDDPVSKHLPDRFFLYGGMQDAEKIIRMSGIQTVIIATPGAAKELNQKLISEIAPYVRRVSFVPDLIGTPMASADLDILFAEKIPILSVRNNLAVRRNRFLKRTFDIVATLLGGVLISPILLFIALRVAIDNRGSVIFAHRRIGRDGKSFSCYKFQTMVPDAEARLKEYIAENPAAKKEWEETFKLEHDPRVTKLGAFLRRTSLDELPQILNVLKGEMSLVGPRPVVAKEIEKYGENIREYYMVRPGITGMWQASGRSDTTYDERVEMDTWYVRNWSIWIDLMYLFKTFKAVIESKGAY